MLTLIIVMGIIGACLLFTGLILQENNIKESSSEIPEVKAELTESQKEEIRRQVNALVSEELNQINERTEASLDKISNTKILEMNDYADTVMGEINKSHNEAVFLYDMLNEKAKEVKKTVKDVNNAADEIKNIKNVSEMKLEKDEEFPEKEVHAADHLELMKSMGFKYDDIADKTQTAVDDNEQSLRVRKPSVKEIIAEYNEGKTAREIARKYNMGVGEVNLVIGLSKKG